MLKRADVDGERRGRGERTAPRDRRIRLSRPFTTGHSLVVLLDANTDWDALASRRRCAVYGARSRRSDDGDADRATALQRAGRCHAARRLWHSEDGEKQSHGVVGYFAGTGAGENKEAVTATTDVISLDLGGDYRRILARHKCEAAGNADASREPTCDRRRDRRQSAVAAAGSRSGRTAHAPRAAGAGRPARGARSTISDGQVGGDEMPMPIRFAVTLGPHVHQLLATPTGAARTIAPRDAAPTAPDWFASMDKNSDRDLSRERVFGHDRAV